MGGLGVRQLHGYSGIAGMQHRSKAAFVLGFRGRICPRDSAVEVIVSSPAASDGSRFVTAELVPYDGDLVKRRPGETTLTRY